MKYIFEKITGEANENWPTILTKLIHNHLQKPPATRMTEKTISNKLPDYRATSTIVKHETNNKTTQKARQIEILMIKGEQQEAKHGLKKLWQKHFIT